MTLHTTLSYVKSSIRIVGFAALGDKLHVLAALLLIGAEIVGFLEELPGAYAGTQMDGEPMQDKYPSGSLLTAGTRRSMDDELVAILKTHQKPRRQL